MEAIRQKRKRFRQKKKEIIKQRKYFATNADAGDSGYTTSPDIQARTMNAVTASTDSTTLSTVPDNDVEAKSDSAVSDTSSFPMNSEWIHLENEAIQIRHEQTLKEAELAEKYSTFVDTEPAFPFNPATCDIPNTVGGVDRLLIKSKMNNLVCKERRALQQAVLFRDKCTELEEKCRALETEKEAVRYFWRNKLVEGQSRAARMVKECLKS